MSKSPTRFYVFIVPYMGWIIGGEGAKGSEGQRYNFIGAWDDDLTHLIGKTPVPRGVAGLQAAAAVRRQPLTGAARGSSLANSLAHLMGKSLGLYRHSCGKDCLVGGTVSDGERLSPYQIGKARARTVEATTMVKILDMFEILWLRIKWGWPVEACPNPKQGCDTR